MEGCRGNSGRLVIMTSKIQSGSADHKIKTLVTYSLTWCGWEKCLAFPEMVKKVC